MENNPQFTLECACCSRPVIVKRRRYLELRRSGDLPVCRSNGCERYAAPQRSKAYRGGVDVPGMPGAKLQRLPGQLLRQAKIRYTIADRAVRPDRIGH